MTSPNQQFSDFLRALDRQAIADINVFVDREISDLHITDPTHISAFRAVAHATLRAGVLVKVAISNQAQVAVITLVHACLPPEWVDVTKTAVVIRRFTESHGVLPMIVELTNGSAIEFTLDEGAFTSSIA